MSLRKCASIFSASVCFLMSFCFYSCNFFCTETMTEVLTRLTKTMEVVRMDLIGEEATDSDEYRSIPSGEDYNVEYIVKNPMGFKFTADVTTAADDNVKIETIEEPYTYEISEDYTKITVTFANEALVALEKGEDLTPVVQIYCDEYGNAIPAYNEKLRCNSRPPLVHGAVAMMNTAYKVTDTLNSSIGKYVLCFNLPDILFDCSGSHVLNGIHSDVCTIRIEGLEGIIGADSASYPESRLSRDDGVELKFTYNSSTYKWEYNELLSTKVPLNLSVNAYNNSYNYSETNGMPAAIFNVGKHPVYIQDQRAAHAEDDFNYKITMTDEKGLSSSVTIGNRYKQLAPVTLSDGYGDEILVNVNNNIKIRSTDVKNGTFDLVLNAPYRAQGTAYGRIDDVNVVYTVYGTEYGTAYEYITSGMKTDQFVYRMLNGWSYKVTGYAHKDGYIDSAVTEWTVHIGVEDVEISVDYRPIQYYAAFELEPYEINASDIDEENGYTVKVNMKVYDMDRVNAIMARKNLRDSDRKELMDKSIYADDDGDGEADTDGARVVNDAEHGAKYELENFELYILDRGTELKEDPDGDDGKVLKIDRTHLEDDYAEFTLPGFLRWQSGTDSYQLYLKVNLHNLNYEEEDDAYNVLCSNLLELTIKGEN